MNNHDSSKSVITFDFTTQLVRYDLDKAWYQIKGPMVYPDNWFWWIKIFYQDANCKVRFDFYKECYQNNGPLWYKWISIITSDFITQIVRFWWSRISDQWTTRVYPDNWFWWIKVKSSFVLDIINTYGVSVWVLGSYFKWWFLEYSGWMVSKD